MVSQLWQQSPVILLMVAGLVVFGTYSVVAYFQDRPADEPAGPDTQREAALFDTIPPG